MATDYITENAHKLAYLAKSYPEMPLDDIRQIVAWTLLDYNNAIWRAKELELISVEQRSVEQKAPHPTKKNKFVTEMVDVPFAVFVDAPLEWSFGTLQDDLQSSIKYMFTQLEAKEDDLEEHYLNSYLQGYPPREHLIAVQYLLETGVLHEYMIEDNDNPYLFYTLKKNAGKNWGQKQFKVNPLTGEANETAIPATEE